MKNQGLLTLTGLAFENYMKGWHGPDSAPPMENTFQTVFGQFLKYRWVPAKAGSLQLQKYTLKL